jgi:hypothetical protein
MSVKITPTVGRILWFIPNEQEERGFRLDPHQPCKADIVYVHQDGTVNARVLTHEGIPCLIFKCQIVQDGDPIPPRKEHYLTWMPYQVGQASKSLPPEKPRPAPAPVDTAAPDPAAEAVARGELPTSKPADPDGLGD